MKQCMLSIGLLAILSVSEAQWSADPQINTPVCTAPGNQTSVQCVSDGAGGAIFVWSDDRYPASVFAQRIDVTGTARWDSGGVRFTSYPWASTQPGIVSDGRGGAIITFLSEGEVYAQRIDQSGVLRWGTDGVRLLGIALSTLHYRYVIATDNANGIVAAMYQLYDFTADNWVTIQRLDSAGQWRWSDRPWIIWGTSTNPVYDDIAICSDVFGSAVVAWTAGSPTNPGDIYAQRIHPDRSFAWPTSGMPICNATGRQAWPAIASDGVGGTIMAWLDGRNLSQGGELFAVRIDSSGTPHTGWPVNGIRICDTVIAESFPSIIGDGTGGAITACNVPQSGESTYQTYVQRISSSGAPLWGTRGIHVSSSTVTATAPVIMSDGADGVIVAWQDGRRSSGDEIFAQHLDAAGAFVWPDSGILICSAPNSRSSVCMTGTVGNGAIIGWQDKRGGTEFDVYAQRVLGSGVLPVQLSSFTALVLGNNRVRLEWRTTCEINNYGFYVERKRQTESDWMELPNSFMCGNGTTNEPHNYSFVDNAPPSGQLQYRLKQTDLDQSVHYSEPIQINSLTSVREIAPKVFTLFPNYPNPFNPETNIKFSVETTDRATVEIYNVLGQRVMTLFDDVAEAGYYYSVRFSGQNLASGVYFYRLQSENKSDLKKLILLR